MNRPLGNAYFYRYLAGGPALRDGRQVTRRDFIIASSGLTSKNALANSVVDATSRFAMAVTAIEQIEQIDLEQLGRINLSLLGAQGGQAFRNKALAFKALRKMNSYECPPPEIAMEQSNNLLKKIGTEHPTIEGTLSIMAGLTLSHPFTEGNGRTSRALFEAFCNLYHSSQLSPYLFVLSNNRMDDFIGFMHSHRDSAFSDIGERFLSDYLIWQTNFNHICDKIISDGVNKINSKMFFLQYNNWFHKILQVFWQNPVVSVKTLPLRIGDYISAKPSLDTLLERKVIKLEDLNGELCFTADDILGVHEEIEAALLSRK